MVTLNFALWAGSHNRTEQPRNNLFPSYTLLTEILPQTTGGKPTGCFIEERKSVSIKKFETLPRFIITTISIRILKIHFSIFVYKAEA